MNWKYLLLVAPLIVVGIGGLHVYIGVELLRDADAAGILMLALAVIYAAISFGMAKEILKSLSKAESKPKLKIRRRSKRERAAFEAGAKAAIDEFELLFEDDNLNLNLYTRYEYPNVDGKVRRDYERFDEYDLHMRGQRAIREAMFKNAYSERID